MGSSNSFLFRELDLVRVKGKEEPISIFEIMVNDDSDADLDLKLISNKFTEALNKYREREFEVAKEMFNDVLTLKEGDLTSQLYVERCEEYLIEPPPEDWDFVYTATSK